MRGILIALALLLLTPVTAHAEPSVWAVGDSITQGHGSADPDRESWPALIGAHRAGDSGGCLITSPCFKTTAMLPRYGHEVLRHRPDAVIVAYGINDLASGTYGPADILAGMEALEARNADRGIATYVATVTPLRGVIHNMFDDGRMELNRLIRAHFGCNVIDFDRALAGKSGRLRAAHDSGDGLHPNAKAYTVMARVAARTLRGAGCLATQPRT